MRKTHPKNKEYKRKWNHSPKGKICRERYNSKTRQSRIDKERERRTGWTPQEYATAFEKQKGCCFLCGIHRSKLKIDLAADHCHKTKKKRALLCSHCNAGIGQMQDDPNRLRKAAEYLEKNGLSGVI